MFLFFTGLVDFLFTIDSTVGRVIFGVLCFFGHIYILLTFLPNVRPNCRYRTPFSCDSLKWFLVLTTASALLGIYSLRCVIWRDRFKKIRMRFLLFVQSLLWSMSDDVIRSQQGTSRRSSRAFWATSLLEPTRTHFSITEDLLDTHQPTPLGHRINRLIVTCTPEGLPRRRRERVPASGVYFASFSYGMFARHGPP